MAMGLLYWRSFTHWLGGMGVLVFLLAIVPMTRGSGASLHLLRAESPGPQVGKLVPKMHQTAKILYGIYVALTLLQIVLLLAGGMPLFDAVTTAFGTAGTGGFAVKNDSMAGYSFYLQTVVTVFMAVFGINFNIFYLLLIREFAKAFFNEELRVYLGIMLGSIALVTVNISHLYPSVREALHHAAFQVSSIMTTTGFATADFNLWPEFSRSLLVLLMVLGACAGSTAAASRPRASSSSSSRCATRCGRCCTPVRSSSRGWTARSSTRAPFTGSTPIWRSTASSSRFPPCSCRSTTFPLKPT